MRLSWGLWRWKDVGGSITYEKKFFNELIFFSDFFWNSGLRGSSKNKIG